MNPVPTVTIVPNTKWLLPKPILRMICLHGFDILARMSGVCKNWQGSAKEIRGEDAFRAMWEPMRFAWLALHGEPMVRPVEPPVNHRIYHMVLSGNRAFGLCASLSDPVFCCQLTEEKPRWAKYPAIKPVDEGIHYAYATASRLCMLVEPSWRYQQQFLRILNIETGDTVANLACKPETEWSFLSRQSGLYFVSHKRGRDGYGLYHVDIDAPIPSIVEVVRPLPNNGSSWRLNNWNDALVATDLSQYTHNGMDYRGYVFDTKGNLAGNVQLPFTRYVVLNNQIYINDLNLNHEVNRSPVVRSVTYKITAIPSSGPLFSIDNEMLVGTNQTLANDGVTWCVDNVLFFGKSSRRPVKIHKTHHVLTSVQRLQHDKLVVIGRPTNGIWASNMTVVTFQPPGPDDKPVVPADPGDEKQPQPVQSRSEREHKRVRPRRIRRSAAPQAVVQRVVATVPQAAGTRQLKIALLCGLMFLAIFVVKRIGRV